MLKIKIALSAIESLSLRTKKFRTPEHKMISPVSRIRKLEKGVGDEPNPSVTIRGRKNIMPPNSAEMIAVMIKKSERFNLLFLTVNAYSDWFSASPNVKLRHPVLSVV